MPDVEKCTINVTVGNGQRMKFEIKCSINMKLQGRKTVKIMKVLYLPGVSRPI